MTDIDTPSAFPFVTTETDYNGATYQVVSPGMTLRDYFAGQSIIGYNPGEFVTGAEVAQRVRRAYAVADAMLREREKAPLP